MDRRRVDIVLLITTLILVGFGSVMIYSASFVVAEDRFYGESDFFLKRHLVRVALGIALLAVFANLDYRRLRKGTLWIFGFALVGLILVFVPGLGLHIRGATRTVKLWFVHFQPAEFMKVAMVLFLAHWLDRKQHLVQRFMPGLFPIVVLIGAVFALIALQPDFGTAIALTATAVILLYVGRARLAHLALAGALALPLVALKMYTSMHSKLRMEAYWNRLFGDGDALDTLQYIDYQLQQSLISLGTGGFFGNGLGESRQKYLFLPDPHTDFVFAVIGEELGFVGATAVMLLFMILAWRGLQIARHAPDAYGFYLAAGLTTLITVHTLINIGMVTGLLPTTGLPLPFLSYGGTWLLFCMISVGILLNISRGHTRRQRMRHV